MQYNIYFRKDNWERFKDETNKSELINQLLENHYSGPTSPSATPSPGFQKEDSGLKTLGETWNTPEFMAALKPHPNNSSVAYDQEGNYYRVKSTNGLVTEVLGAE